MDTQQVNENEKNNQVNEKNNQQVNDNDNQTQEPILFGSDATRFNNFNFGTIITRQIDVQENLLVSAIVTVTPTEGGIVYIPPDTTIVYLTSIDPYIQLTFLLPLKPKYGQVIIFTSNADVSSIIFDGNGETFGVLMPTNVIASTPIRIVFANTWLLI